MVDERRRMCAKEDTNTLANLVSSDELKSLISMNIQKYLVISLGYFQYFP